MARAAAPGLKRSYKDEEYKEGGGFYDGPAPTPGMHPVKLVDVGDHTSQDGNEGVKWTYDITEGKFAGWRGYVYTNDSTTLWKEQEMLVALGVIKPNAELNMSYANIIKKAQPARARIINELYEGEATGKIRTLLKADANAGKAKGRPADDEVDEDFEDEPLQDSDERDERAEELEALTLVRLKAEAKKAGLGLADYKGKTEDEIIDLILDAEFPESEESEEEPEEDEDQEPEEFDGEALQEELEKLSPVKLKALAKKEYGATLADLKGLDTDEIIEWVLDKAEEAFDEAADAEGDEEPEPEEAPEPPKRTARSTRPARGRKSTTDEPPF